MVAIWPVLKKSEQNCCQFVIIFNWFINFQSTKIIIIFLSSDQRNHIERIFVVIKVPFENMFLFLFNIIIYDACNKRINTYVCPKYTYIHFYQFKYTFQNTFHRQREVYEV